MIINQEEVQKLLPLFNKGLSPADLCQKLMEQGYLLHDAILIITGAEIGVRVVSSALSNINLALSKLEEVP